MTSHSNVRLLSTVLWAFGKLLPQHPRTFKPFLDQIRALVLSLVSPTSMTLPLDSSASSTHGQPCLEIIAHRARHVLVLLSIGSSKNASIQEWEKSLSHVIFAAHRTADQVFRGLVEDLDPAMWDDSTQAGMRSLEGICQMLDEESEWPGWRGINAGLERLNGHLQTVQSYLLFPTLTPVAVPIAKIIGLAERILAILPPSGKNSKDSSSGTPTKPEISRDEREALWTWLPRLHVSTLNLVVQLMIRLEENSASFHEQVLGATLWTFDHEHTHIEIREAVYRILPLLLARCKPSQHRSVASSLATCLEVCCGDIMPPETDQSLSKGSAVPLDLTSTNHSRSADGYSKSVDAHPEPSRTSSDLQEAAISVLCAALQYLPAESIPFPVRCKVDQTAVLVQSERLIQASVLNPAARRRRKQQNSVVPFLARQFPQSTGTETLLRPRMAPLQPNGGRLLEDSDEEITEREAAFETNGTLSSATPHNLTQEHLPANLENGRPEAAEAGIEQPIIERRSPGSSLRTTQQHVLEAITPIKRTRESDSEVAPDEEMERKRTRTGDDNEIYVAPLNEQDLPPRIAPPSLDTPISAEPLAHLRTGGENIVDDDSDDSSIPPIDPTMDTEDEEDDEELNDSD